MDPTLFRLLVEAAGTTVALSAVSIASGLLIGLAVSAAMLSRSRALAVPARAFVSFFRGVPLLVQLLLIYNLLPSVGIDLPGGVAAAIGLTLCTAAYQAETLRGGFAKAPAHAAVREAKEETSLDVEVVAMLHAYGKPDRDPRGHTVSIVYVAHQLGHDEPKAADDAKNVKTFALDELPPLAFDHATIIADYLIWKKNGARPPATR